jgi:DNA-binding winged helix-turn-helix (wHTH) protein
MYDISATYGNLVIDGPAWEVRLDGAVLDLTRTEFEILMVLAARPRQVASGDELVRLVWGDGWFGDDNNLAVHVSKLRRKLGESGLRPRFIHTVRGVGYRFDPGEDSAGHAPHAAIEYPALRSHPRAVEIRTDGQLRVICVRPDDAPVLGFEPCRMLGRLLPVAADHPWDNPVSAIDGIQILIASGVREWAARYVVKRADGTRAHADVATRLLVDEAGQLEELHLTILERSQVTGGSPGGATNAGHQPAARIA